MEQKKPEELTAKEILSKLKEEGLYPCLVNKGIIPLKVNLYYEMDNLYNVRMIVNKELNDCKMQSLVDVATSFDCHDNTIRTALKMMNQ